jgi:sulfopyruvate decarboxylase subunit alpha
MTVSLDNSKAVYQGIKDAGVRFITALPETWLVYLLQLAEEDPEMRLIEVAKERAAAYAAELEAANKTGLTEARTAYAPPSPIFSEMSRLREAICP